MSTTTQNEWAERFDKEFPNLRMYYSDGLAPCEDDVKAFIAKELADARKEGYEEGKADQIKRLIPPILDNEWVVSTTMTNGKKILSHRIIITDRELDQSGYLLERMGRDLSYEFGKYLATLRKESK